MKANRLPRRVVKRLSDAEHRALDELRFGSPDAARRGELKTQLGWRRTREETIAYAQALLARGMIITAVASRLNIERRYLARALNDDATPDLVPRKPASGVGKTATNLQTPTRDSRRGNLPAPAAGFASFAELDAWLEAGL